MMSFINELRILFAELIFLQALRVMPNSAPEATLLQEAHNDYTSQAAQHARWQKFPA